MKKLMLFALLVLIGCTKEGQDVMTLEVNTSATVEILYKINGPYTINDAGKIISFDEPYYYVTSNGSYSTAIDLYLGDTIAIHSFDKINHKGNIQILILKKKKILHEANLLGSGWTQYIYR